MSKVVTVTERSAGVGPVGIARNEAFPIVLTLWTVNSNGTQANLTEEEAVELADDLVTLIERCRAQKIVDDVQSAARHVVFVEGKAYFCIRCHRAVKAPAHHDKACPKYEAPAAGGGCSAERDMTGSDEDPNTWGEVNADESV